MAHRSPVAPPETAAPALEWPAPGVDERLRKRTRQLALANQLGARLSAMTDVDAIIEAAVDELHGAFGYYLCCAARLRDDDIVEAAAERGEVPQDRGWSQPRDVGLIGRCLRERRPILVQRRACRTPTTSISRETVDVGSEIVAPVFVGDALWGALDVEEIEAEAFDEDDLVLAADGRRPARLGAALGARSTSSSSRAYLGHGGGARLRARGQGRLHGRARALDRRAGRGGRTTARAWTSSELRDLRSAPSSTTSARSPIPEAILNKRGPLTPAERAIVERHTVVGEQILAPVDVPRLACAGSCATSTSAGTAAATRTASPVRRSRSARGSSSPATRCTR